MLIDDLIAEALAFQRRCRAGECAISDMSDRERAGMYLRLSGTLAAIGNYEEIERAVGGTVREETCALLREAVRGLDDEEEGTG